MLVLSRKIDQTIKVGEVTFTIVRINGNQVRVGIDAPKDQPILRGELEKKRDSATAKPLSDDRCQRSKKHLTEASK